MTEQSTIIFTQKKTLNGGGPIQMHCRLETMDNHIVKELSTYRRMCTFEETDTWIDLGGNIGAFAVPVAQACYHVVTVEPLESNLDLMTRNILLNKVETKVSINETAISGSLKTGDKISFFEAVGAQRGCSSMIPTKGRIERTVEVLNINDLMWAITGTGMPNFQRPGKLKMKIDIEGAEYDVITKMDPKYLVQIDEVVMEYHAKFCKDPTREKYEEILDCFRRAGLTNITRSGSEDSSRTWMGWPFLCHAAREKEV
jgi:FkbM family methyltransferase